MARILSPVVVGRLLVVSLVALFAFSWSQISIASGPICYPKAEKGYKEVGGVYWQECESDFKDIGAFCQKPASYGRGAGYAIWNNKKCDRENAETGGCEKYGAMWYPKCKKDFHAVGCCVCSPDCPKGMSDTGTGCKKNSYVKAPIGCP